MDISDSERISPLSHLTPKVQAEQESHAHSAKEPSSSTSQHPAPDQVTVSQSVNQHQAIQDIVKQIPEVRPDRVAEIRKALESGQYHVPSDLVADRIIRDILINQPPTNKKS